VITTDELMIAVKKSNMPKETKESVNKLLDMFEFGERTKMSPYLNDIENDNLMKLGAFASHYIGMINGYSQSKRVDNGYIKALKVAQHFTELALKIRMTHMDKSELDRIVRETLKHTIMVTPLDSIKRKEKEIMELNSRTHIEDEDFCDMAEITIESTCKVCDNNIEQAKVCRLRELFMRYDICPLDVDAEVCQYKYRED